MVAEFDGKVRMVDRICGEEVLSAQSRFPDEKYSVLVERAVNH